MRTTLTRFVVREMRLKRTPRSLCWARLCTMLSTNQKQMPPRPKASQPARARQSCRCAGGVGGMVELATGSAPMHRATLMATPPRAARFHAMNTLSLALSEAKRLM